MISQRVILIGIVFFALALRLYGINWDQGQHLHPDERFLTMVTMALKWPETAQMYFNTNASPLNPQNVGFSFYVYGTYPLYFVKFVAEQLGLSDYHNLTLVGRALSAVVDTLIVCLVYKLVDLISKNKKWALFSAASYTLLVLPIQLAHFFTVDTYLVFFSLLGFIFLNKIQTTGRLHYFYSVATGICFGLAAAAKISAIFLGPVVGIVLLQYFFKNYKIKLIIASLIILVFSLVTLRIAYPYLFNGMALNQKVVNNWKEMKSYDNPNGYFPPAIMWIETKPYIFPMLNSALWGVGIPGFALLAAGMFILVGRHRFKYMLVWLPVLIVVGYQGIQYAKPLRYFYLIYPFIAICIGLALQSLSIKMRYFLVVLMLIWPLAFMSIYSRPHSRVQASQWIYKNIPVGSSLGTEHWDDGLPVPLPGNSYTNYNLIELHLFDVDSVEKWANIAAQLYQLDYIVLSSNRVYGSTMTVPKKYPINTKYYNALFNGDLGFVKVGEFTSRPRLPIPGVKLCLTPPSVWYGKIAKNAQWCNEEGISIVDDYADETFTVYDHPKVIIFKKVAQKNYLDILLPGL